MPEYHEPVMVNEALEFLQPRSGQVCMDCTVGGGGHAVEIVKRILPDGKLLGIDRDDDALKAAAKRLSEYPGNVILEKGNFSDIETIAWRSGIESVNGVIFDLGVSSYQLETPERGFSFRHEAELDMRMDTTQPVTAKDIVNSYSERRLTEIIRDYGEERWAKRIAKFIVDRRSTRPIRTTTELVDIIKAAVPAGARGDRIHPATRTFQALRIAVNNELESLQAGLDAAIKLLVPTGRVVVLSYHSLEDRIVKEAFTRQAGRCTCPPGLPICACGARENVKILTKKPVLPTDEEVRANPRARSAKLRAAQKL